MSTFDSWINAKVEEATAREERAIEHMPKSKRMRDTQFRGYANALHKELVAIHYEGFTNNWNSVDIDRRVIQAIARRAYDFEAHTVGYALEYLHECGREMPGGMKTRIVPSIPDMTELPKEQE